MGLSFQTAMLSFVHLCLQHINADSSFSRLPTHPSCQWWNVTFVTIKTSDLLRILLSGIIQYILQIRSARTFQRMFDEEFCLMTAINQVVDSALLNPRNLNEKVLILVYSTASNPRYTNQCNVTASHDLRQ